MRTDEALRLVATARTDTDLFGADWSARRYRELVAALHPDRLGTADDRTQAAATDAYVRVTRAWRAHRRGPLGGYQLGGHRLDRLAHVGDLADLYHAEPDLLVKVPRDPADNDLIAREARALRAIEERGDPRYLPYVPRLVDSFRHRDLSTGVERQVNVLATAPGLHSLDEVRRAYPDGLDGRDAAWMWRRLLVALGLAHRAGVVHGAVLPRHVLIEPDAHGVVLVGWGCSVVIGGPMTSAPTVNGDPTVASSPTIGGVPAATGGAVPALVTGYEDWYPPEVTAKRPCGPGTDLAMAARCMGWLMGDRAPRELRAFAGGCQLPALAARPDDAWRLLSELDDVLERCYGPRVFRPFTLNP